MGWKNLHLTNRLELEVLEWELLEREQLEMYTLFKGG